MKVFVLDRTLNENYGSFARSFTRIRAEDIKSELDEKLVASGRYRNASSILGGPDGVMIPKLSHTDIVRWTREAG